jgi:hypothetical protein
LILITLPLAIMVSKLEFDRDRADGWQKVKF